MHFLKSMVGRKIVMAVSGLMMVLFVVAHLLGNTSIFAGPNAINAYAMKLHELVPLLWSYRVVMIVMLSLHFFYGIQLTLENNKAKPQAYTVKKSLSATFAGKTMIWTGLILGAFLVYHLLQFTFQVTNPEISADRNLDPLGRPDVFHMVVLTFQKTLISLIYVAAMIALAFHLTHGIQSFFQTLGLNNDRTLPVIIKSGTVAAVIVFLGFIAIPIIIFVGILKG
ncbi:MAG TPA: succinate dehydrogenase/fumarate reductase cytochrome b subunit [Nitrospiraceae bacterium]|nr:succinate dehydrogenase/fumarate reductase cytochrome b subunit [Nitrospiraceae bacterium]